MNKRIITVLFCLYSVISLSQSETDSIKKGWNVGFLPAVAFDSDLGIYYGIIINPFDYGDGSIYPNYFQSVYLQVSGYSRGSSEHIFEYESYSLLPGVKFNVKLKYQGYKAYPFYGFNGNESIYHHEWENTEDPAYKTRMFYRIERKNIKISSDLQDTIGNSRFQWHAGWFMGYYRIGPVNIEKMNKKLSGDEVLPDTATLYDNYNDWGLIGDAEKNGGIINTFLAGIIYDSRNKLTNPDRGIFTELNIRWMPSLLTEGRYSSLSLGLIHKQYFTILNRRLIFAYRLWLNANLAGNQPFYARQLLTTFTGVEGYGGAFTIRGALMQRIVADDFFLGTLELRSRLVNFRLIKQNWYIGAVLFMDAGRILNPVKLNLEDLPPVSLSAYFNTGDRSIHKSFGAGLKLAMNENFVLSAEFAVPSDPQDGISGLYLGLGYQF